MNSPNRREPLFADLIYSEEGERVRVVDVGGVPHYAIPHGDFLRHVEAEYVDRQVVVMLQEHFRSMRDVIADGVVHMLGEENLFTRASIDHAIENLDRILEAGHVDTNELRTALWMMKFRVVVDFHGDVVRLDIPGWEDGDGEL
jgi:hypothetical protein